ncbi:hypothetical protein CDV36_006062 [Fusarium kuroshium]|uniref:Uncharacterized protein n=3 Tax=Fusarium solani species complex TaxID=232080 RepID=A0A3M2SAP8_9HYPO|nr:hypothetical protein CDV36_006062 [Fusarium kuroshium]RSL98219.1 hypothetical protein CEP52_010434 [Fusarium oligoseptatum]RSM05383.1 hypothetical protein CDV31_009621 [Fusarium ambrosium]
MSLGNKDAGGTGAPSSDFEKGTVTKTKFHPQAASKDKARELLAAHNIDFNPDSPEAKRVLRKIDMRIMPMCFFVYVLMLMACTP